MEFQVLSINDVEEEDLYRFLLLINNHVVPSLSERIDLKNYPRKIKTRSIGKAVVHNNELIGIAVFYPPDKKDNYIYWTLLAVKEEYRGLNIGKRLVNDVIKTAREMKAKGIKLQTMSTAHKLIAYYQTFGFELYGFAANRGDTIVRSALLKIKIL